MFRKVSYIIVSIFLFTASPLFAADTDWAQVADEIQTELDSSVEAYKEGRAKEAKATVSNAYFNLFEASGMEGAVSVHISDKRKTEVEGLFGAMRGAIAKGKPLVEVTKKKELLVAAVKYDAWKLNEVSSTSTYSLIFNSFMIILREGFEAILIISALTAYLVKTGHKEKVKVIYAGAVLALIASVLSAVLLNTIFKISGAAQEALEGVTMLTATVVLFYVSYWLITKVEVKRWHHYIKSKIKDSLGRGNVMTLGFAAFLAVFREGAETILFYQALYSTSDGNSQAILTGFIPGCIVLVAIFFIFKYASVRIPIAPFFAATSALLYYLAFSFAGKGVLELQEAGWISVSFIDGFPSINLLGIYPTWEGVILQSTLIVALFATFGYMIISRRADYNKKERAEG